MLGIVAVVLLITWAKWHPFLALILGSAVLGVVAALPPGDIVTSFTTGFGSTVGSVGVLIALGSMIGALLADSGGADSIVRTHRRQGGSATALPWAMAASRRCSACRCSSRSAWCCWSRSCCWWRGAPGSRC